MSAEDRFHALKEHLDDLYAELAYLEEEIADTEAQLAELGYESDDDTFVEFTADEDFFGPDRDELFIDDESEDE